MVETTDLFSQCIFYFFLFQFLWVSMQGKLFLLSPLQQGVHTAIQVSESPWKLIFRNNKCQSTSPSPVCHTTQPIRDEVASNSAQEALLE